MVSGCRVRRRTVRGINNRHLDVDILGCCCQGSGGSGSRKGRYRYRGSIAKLTRGENGRVPGSSSTNRIEEIWGNGKWEMRNEKHVKKLPAF